MPPQPESVGEWLRYARSDLELAETPRGPHVLLEMLCFHAQQAAEKAIKAVLILHGIKPPKTHDLSVLLDRLPAEVPTTAEIEEARALTGYATISRYPWAGTRVSRGPGCRPVVVKWAEGMIGES